MMLSPLVSISIVTYNGEKWITQCLKSIKKQSFRNWQVLLIDNHSQDKTVDSIRQLMPKARLILNKKNLGFAGGHNIGISHSTGKYILCLNQDVVLHCNFLKEAVAVMETDSKISAVQGKLYRLSFCHCEEGRALLGRPKQSRCYTKQWPRDCRIARRLYLGAPRNDRLVIDTTGLVMFKNRRVINRGQGEIDQGQYDKIEEIFGADGAAPVYRRTALESVALPRVSHLSRSEAISASASTKYRLPRRLSPRSSRGSGLLAMTEKEYFDQDFFAYKEDIDLAWRLRLAGWKTVYQPKALAWHARGVGINTGTGPGLVPPTNWELIRQHQQISKFCRQLSWKNQRLMQIKNELPSLLLSHLPLVFWKELKSTGYILLREPSMLKSVAQFFKQAPGAWQKRKAVMAKKTVTTQEMKRWFV